MNPCHYPQMTRPRSRSPSPIPNLMQRERLDQDDHDEGGQNNLSVNYRRSFHGEEDHHNQSEKRSSSTRPCSRGGAPINEFLSHSQPIDALVRIESPPCVSRESGKELLPRRMRSRSSGEMDEIAGAMPNYGSMSTRNVNAVETNNNFSRSEGHMPRSRSPRLKRQKSYYTPSMIDELRKRNKLYFLDTITKLRHFHGFPWKLTLQIVKVVLITYQIVVFGGQRENIVDYFERSELAYKHLLLKDWETGYETMPYPPATGQYAVYTLDDLYSHMSFVMKQYYNLTELSLASIHLSRDNETGSVIPMELCFKANYYEEFPNGTYVVAGKLLSNCTFVYPLGDPGNYTFDVKRYLEENNFYLPFNRTLEIKLKIHIRTFHLNLLQTHYGSTCYNVTVTVAYTNAQRSGQVVIALGATPREIECTKKILSPKVNGEMKRMRVRVIAYDAVVIAICCLSTILCSRSLKRCNKLRMDTAQYFKLCRGRPFTVSSHMEYINMWYIVIICNDVFTVVGSCFKIQLESRVFSVSSENYEICSILLGLGIFLTYVGILRYLSFFKSYNVLILTLKTSFPHVIRFLFCAICLYTGFLFCGWIVFSPYHIKFRKLSTASECLFSLVNGDDMFVTFSALTNKSNAIWYFHRAYLYVFIAIFIYVVLSVFIAVIMDNYENLKHYYEKGFPRTEVQSFIQEDGEVSLAELFSHVGRGGRCQSWFFCIFPCLNCLRRANRIATDREELLNTI